MLNKLKIEKHWTLLKIWVQTKNKNKNLIIYLLILKINHLKLESIKKKFN